MSALHVGWQRSLVVRLVGMSLLLLLLVGWLQALPWPFYGSLLVAAGLFAQQGWSARGRDRDACFRAFLANNWVGAVIFLGIFLSGLLAG